MSSTLTGIMVWHCRKSDNKVLYAKQIQTHRRLQDMKNLVLAIGFWLALSVSAQAAMFEDDGCKLSTKPTGKVTVYCPKASDLEKYVFDLQFCPDQIKYTVGCGLNLKKNFEITSPTTAEVMLDMGAVRQGQRAFNPKMNTTTWSHVMASKAGEGLIVEMSDPNPDSDDGRGGCHYTFVADLPPGSYIPNKPELCGGGYVKPVAKVATSGGANGSDQGAVAIATNQSAAAAHNSAAATNQSAAANNSSEAVANSFLNINQVATGKGKNTAIIYAPGASQKNITQIVRGSSADVKVYANKSGKKEGGGIKNVITYVGPTFQTIHLGTGAGDYDPFTCTRCHNDYAKADARIKALILKNMSCAANESCQDEKPTKKGKK